MTLKTSIPLQHRGPLAWWLTVLAAVASAALCCTMAKAAGNPTAEAKAAYQKQVAACNSGHTGEDRATCLKEAGAALAASKNGALADDATGSVYRQNALKRCRELPQADQKDCVARLEDGTTNGSVAGGGVIRELRTEQVMPAASAASPAGQ